MIPKPRRFIDEEYLDVIRTLHCAVCFAVPAEPHHLISRGAGGSDHYCVPLCRKHHSELEQVGKTKFEHKHDIDLWRYNSMLLSRYAAKLKESGL